MPSGKKLNLTFFKRDLMEFLESNESASRKEIIEWINDYEAQIANTIKDIETRFEKLFKGGIVKLEQCPDGNSQYIVAIYGVEPTIEKKRGIWFGRANRKR